MFEKGEYVVYGSKGVCKIQDISHVDIPGVDRNRLFYIMHPVQNSEQTVYLPIDSNKVMIRKVMTPEEAKRLIQDIPSIEVLYRMRSSAKPAIKQLCMSAAAVPGSVF